MKIKNILTILLLLFSFTLTAQFAAEFQNFGPNSAVTVGDHNVRGIFGSDEGIFIVGDLLDDGSHYLIDADGKEYQIVNIVATSPLEFEVNNLNGETQAPANGFSQLTARNISTNQYYISAGISKSLEAKIQRINVFIETSSGGINDAQVRAITSDSVKVERSARITQDSLNYVSSFPWGDTTARAVPAYLGDLDDLRFGWVFSASSLNRPAGVSQGWVRTVPFNESGQFFLQKFYAVISDSGEFETYERRRLNVGGWQDWIKTVGSIITNFKPGSGLDGDTLILNQDTILFPLYGIATISDDVTDVDDNISPYRFDNGAGTITDFGYSLKSINGGAVLFDFDGSVSGDTVRIISTDTIPLCYEQNRNTDIFSSSPDIIDVTDGIYDIREGAFYKSTNEAAGQLALVGDTTALWISRMPGAKRFVQTSNNRKPRLETDELAFDGINDRMVINIHEDPIGTPKTIAFVGRLSGGEENATLISGGPTGPGGQDYANTIGGWQIARGSTTNGTQDSIVIRYRGNAGNIDIGFGLWSGVTDNEKHYYRLNYVGNKIVFKIDGVEVLSRSLGSDQLLTQFIRLFGNRSDQVISEGKISEFFMSDTLTESQNEILDDYFVSKYDIESPVINRLYSPVTGYMSVSNWVRVEGEDVTFYNVVTEEVRDTIPAPTLGECNTIASYNFIRDEVVYTPMRYDFLGDDTTTSFVVPDDIGSSAQILVYVGGIVVSTNEYTIDQFNNSIDFVTAPASLEDITIVILAL